MNAVTEASVHQTGRRPDYEVAYCCLLDSLDCGLRALQHADCTSMIGPVVPGATMAGGARVPGTSYDLDPVQAAFSIGTMMHWLDCNDITFAAAWGHPSDALGGVLAVTDYLSRKAIAEARSPLIVRDVLDAMLRAHSIQRIVALEHGDTCGAAERESVLRQATAAVVTSLLGGNEGHVANALYHARVDGPRSPRATAEQPGSGWRSRWALGDASSRGVRLALLAVRGGQGPAQSSSTDSAIKNVLATRDTSDWSPSGCDAIKEAGSHTLQRLEARVAAHFAPVQANKINGLLADPSRLAATPVHEFLAVLVKN